MRDSLREHSNGKNNKAISEDTQEIPQSRRTERRREEEETLRNKRHICNNRRTNKSRSAKVERSVEKILGGTSLFILMQLQIPNICSVLNKAVFLFAAFPCSYLGYCSCKRPYQACSNYSPGVTCFTY